MFAVLRAYLSVFAFLAPNRDHARREHSLIEGSLREAFAEYRARGLARTPAAFAALWDNLAELWPLALASKTRADAACGPGNDRHYELRLASAAGALLFASVGVYAVLATGAPELPRNTVARVFAEGDPRAGEVEVIGEFDSLQESIYIGSGKTVCIDAELRGPELTNDIVNTPSTPEQLAKCLRYGAPSPSKSDPSGTALPIRTFR